MSDAGLRERLRAWWDRRPGTARSGGRAAVRIVVEFYRDEPGWVFRVPSLRITGGAPTREEAVRRCMDAIRFALEAPAEAAICPTNPAQRLYVDAQLQPPRRPALV